MKANCDSQTQTVVGYVCDVSTRQGRSTLKDAVENNFGGRLDCLVNNVGTNKLSPIEDSTEEDYEVMMKSNLDSCFFLCKIFSENLSKSNGCVVNIASVAGVSSSGTGSIYAATKGAMIQLTRALACEWGARNVEPLCSSDDLRY